MPTLTKSKYMNGEQCVRLLWKAHHKHLPEVSLADQHKFDQGYEFEKYVYLIFPQSEDLSELRTEFEKNKEKTQELIKKKKTIFEAGVQYKNYFIRADILEHKNGWNLYEIKASTEVHDQYLPDLAFQKFVLEKSGLKINKCFVIHLNKEYVKNGKINPKELISIEEVTENVDLITDVEKNAKKYYQVIQQEEEPEIDISKKCNHPYECPLKEQCWGTLPEHHLLQLTNWRQYWPMFEEGIKEMKHIPKHIKLNDKDEVIRKASVEKSIYTSKEHLKHFMKTLEFPLYHFDFETFDTAVPIYDKSRPYQKIPFQYSLHIQQKDGKLEHFEYLASGDEDPRIGLLKQLKKEIAGKGSIVVFNKSFEVSVLTKLAEDFPAEAEWLNQMLGRIVDLAVPFQHYHYYNPKQKGSYSLKKVLPAIAGKDYSELEINNGGDASALYFYSHIKKELKNKEEIRKNLLRYCCLDTEGMVWIVEELRKLLYKREVFI